MLSVASGHCQVEKRTPSSCHASLPQGPAGRLSGKRPGSPLMIRATGTAAATERAPPAWSLSAWLSSSISRRSMPRPRRVGSTATSPRSKSPRRGPASYSQVCWRVRISTDSPWPTSSTRTSVWPWGGALECGQNIGNSNARPSGRSGSPAGARHSSAPNRARAMLQAGGAMGCQAGEYADRRPSRPSRTSSTPPASHSSPSPTAGSHSSRLPTSARGTTSNSTQGTAIRFASAPAGLSGRPRASNTGASPRAMSHCARPQASQPAPRPRRPAKP